MTEEEAQNNNGIRPLSNEEKTSLKAGIFDHLDLMQAVPDVDEMQPAPDSRPAPVRRLPLRSMAAAVFLLLAAAAWLLRDLPALRPGRTLFLAERTGPNEMKRILLPDSSMVILNANSSLEYSPDLATAENREVRLEGNAFFNIKKSAGMRRFVVHARSLAITVLGTELNVNARTAATAVSLISGKVKVTVDSNSQEPVYLLPGYTASFDTLRKSLISNPSNTSLYSAWTDGKWNFRHTSMEEIGQLIEEYYGSQVYFQNERDKRLCINAIMEVGSLQKLIPVLEQTLHIRIILSDNRLIIE